MYLCVREGGGEESAREGGKESDTVGQGRERQTERGDGDEEGGQKREGKGKNCLLVTG